MTHGTEAEKEAFIDRCQGFLKGPQLAAIVRTLKLRKLYISRFTSVMMPFDLYSQKGRHEERALVDSGATANFIDYKTVEETRARKQKARHNEVRQKHRRHA